MDDDDRERLLMLCAAILIISAIWGTIRLVREHSAKAATSHRSAP